MVNRFVLTPFFLDEPRDTLREVAEADWVMNAPALPEGETQARMAVVHEALAQRVAEVVREGGRPVSVAGDCCATIGLVAGLQRAGVNPTLLWLDAHGDFNTWETTPSGFLGGMPLAMMVGRGEQTLPQAVGLARVPEARVVLCDARDLDPGERAALDDSRVQRFNDLKGLLASDTLNAPLYVHFDTDIVNPKDAPAQSYATQGGPSADEMREFLRALARTKNIVAISMCAWNPALDTDGRTREVSMELLGALVQG